MNRTFYTIFLALLCINFVFAQKGELYLYNYSSPVSNTDNLNRAVIQDQQGLLHFANTKGIISYDGVRWEITNTLSTPYSLAVDSTHQGRIYVGCAENFGFLDEDFAGRKMYIPISGANKRFGEINHIILNQDYAFFYSDKVIYRVSLNTQKVEKVWIAREESTFAGIFKRKNQVYVNIYGKGLHEIKHDQLVKLSEKDPFSNVYIHQGIDFDHRNTLLATDNNHLYQFNGVESKPYHFEADQYVAENMLKSINNINDETFAVATLSGGCILIGKHNGQTIQTINYQTGLPDDEVLAMYPDNYGGLWLCTEYSITRADMNLPIQSFSEYPGLEGNITTMIKPDSVLYVASSEGVFYLDKVSNYEELVTIVNREKEKLTEIQTTIERTIQVSPEEENRLGRFFKTLFGSKVEEEKKDEKLRKKEERRARRLEKRNQRKNKGETDTTSVVTEEKDIPESTDEPLDEGEDNSVMISSSIARKALNPVYKTTTSTHYEYISKKNQKNYAIQSIPFVYKKIQGLNAKCHQLVAYKDKILAATNLGLYEISKNTAKLIIPDANIHFIYNSAQHPDRFYIASNNGIFFLSYAKNIWKVSEKLKDVNQSIFSIAGKGNELWLGSENMAFKIELGSEGQPLKSKRYTFEHSYAENIIVRMINDKPAFFLSSGIYGYHPKKDSLYLDKDLQSYFNPRAQVLFRQAGYTWIRPDARWENIHQPENVDKLRSNFLNLFKQIEDIYVDSEENLWIITSNSLYRVKSDAKAYQGDKFKLFVKKVSDIQGNPLNLHNLRLNYKNNAIKIELASPFYLSEGATQYRYKIDQLGQEWSLWGDEPSITIPYLPSGHYTIRFEARNIFGQTSETAIYDFDVAPKYWEKWWFYLILIMFAVFLGVAFFKLRTQALTTANRILEQKVTQKTTEIAHQKKQLEIAFDEIAKKNKDITGSIQYAQRIQQAILPFDETIYSHVPDSFIFFQPRDVVSGDFYWFAEKGDEMVVVVADCTGHGVPGAFMSMIGHTLLSQIINEKNITDPASILHHLDLGIVMALKQDDPKSTRSDGMDITICTINKNKKQVVFSGANNALFYVKNGECETIKADRLGIGGLQRWDKKFTNHVIDITEDTYFYMSTDGFPDQFGGPEGKKFMRKRFSMLMEKISHKPGKEQQTILHRFLNDWKGDRRQVDDILILGFRMS